MKTIKFHFKDTWSDASTGSVQNIEYSTETIHVYDEEEAKREVKKLQLSVGTSFEYGVKHERVIIGTDNIVMEPEKLTKEQMFDFMLANNVELGLDGTLWTKTDGNKVRKKYHVTINSTGMAGYDLEDAINQYVLMQRNN
jgi:hypothetical protein